jgi:hypothetical protein
MGPWDLGRWYRPLAVLGVAGCAGLIAIGMQPPNERSTWVVGAFAIALAAAWFGGARRRFPGPPRCGQAHRGASSWASDGDPGNIRRVAK